MKLEFNWKWTALSSALLLATIQPSQAQTYTEMNAGLFGLSSADGLWLDADLDGDLDLLLIGSPDGLDPNTELYLFDGVDNFTSPAAGLDPVQMGAVASADVDNDGDLDLFLSGDEAFFSPLAALYLNDGTGSFAVSTGPFRQVMAGAAAFGDFDNDGDQDLLIAGVDGTLSERYTELYQNDGNGNFSLADTFNGLTVGDLHWVDFDVDGDLDFACCGYNGSAQVTVLFRNDAGVFTALESGLLGVGESDMDWADVDADGDPDLALCGKDNANNRFTSIYINNGSGQFELLDADLPGVSAGSVSWGDADNDGDYDLLISGQDSSLGYLCALYLNTEAGFVAAASDMAGVAEGLAGWGDVDRDGDLDLFNAGSGGSFTRYARVYQSSDMGVNQAPVAPVELSASQVSPDAVLLEWSAGSDAETPAAGLSYNLRLGTSEGGQDVLPAAADPATGQRHIACAGNAGSALSWRIDGLEEGVYTWAVQSIDAGFAGSAFSIEGSFEIGDVTVSPDLAARAEMFRLNAWPNPFNPVTHIHYELTHPSEVRLRVFDMSGHQLRELQAGLISAGSHAVRFDGAGLASGCYIYQLEANGRVESGQVLLLK